MQVTSFQLNRSDLIFQYYMAMNNEKRVGCAERTKASQKTGFTPHEALLVRYIGNLSEASHILRSLSQKSWR